MRQTPSSRTKTHLLLGTIAACAPRHLTRRSARPAPPAAASAARASRSWCASQYCRSLSAVRSTPVPAGDQPQHDVVAALAQRAHERAQRRARRPLAPRLGRRAVDAPAALLEHQRHGLALRQLDVDPRRDARRLLADALAERLRVGRVRGQPGRERLVAACASGSRPTSARTRARRSPRAERRAELLQRRRRPLRLVRARQRRRPATRTAARATAAPRPSPSRRFAGRGGQSRHRRSAPAAGAASSGRPAGDGQPVGIVGVALAAAGDDADQHGARLRPRMLGAQRLAARARSACRAPATTPASLAISSFAVARSGGAISTVEHDRRRGGVA